MNNSTRKCSRSCYNNTLGTISILFALCSVVYGFGRYVGWWTLNKSVGDILIAIWVIVPPIVFWFDWLIFFPEIKEMPGGIEAAKVTYELNRNVWVALIVVLYALFGFRPFWL